MAIGSIGFGSYSAYQNSNMSGAFSYGRGSSQGVSSDASEVAGVYTSSQAAISKNSVHTEEEAIKAGMSDAQIKGLKRSGRIECQSCATRTYQDGSDESDVSFKAAAHISPEASAARVRGHEQEHVANAYEKASSNNGRVLQASVTIHNAICPECGRSYTAGGLTTTRIAYSDDKYGQNAKSQDQASIVGSNLDLAV